MRTDEGVHGLGETFMGAAAVEAYVHESAAPKLIGRDPIQIEAINRSLINYLGWRGTGVETRGNSAIDIALWDLLGQATGRPIHALLGGASRPAIRIYNTCAGYRYIRNRPVQKVDNWGLPAAGANGSQADESESSNGSQADESESSSGGSSSSTSRGSGSTSRSRRTTGSRGSTARKAS